MAEAKETTEIDHSTRAAELVSIFRVLSNRANTHMDDAWAQMLDVPKSSDEYYVAIGAISRSLERLKAEIIGSHLRGPSKEMYAGAVNALTQYVLVERLRELTTDNLKGELDSFRLLTLLDDVLLPHANRKISDETLADWDGTLSKLIEGTNAAFEDDVLREFVTRELSSLQWAIRNYQWLGIDGISRAYGAMAAELARSSGMKGAQAKEAKTWYQRAKKPLIAIGVGIAVSSAVVEQIDNVLTHGGNIFETITDGTAGESARSKSAVISTSTQPKRLGPAQKK